MPLHSHLTITNPWKYLFLHNFCVPLTQAHAEACITKLFPLVNFIGCPELTSGQTMVPRQVWKPCWEMEWLFFRSGGGQAGSGAQRHFPAFRVRGGTTPALWAPCPSHPAHVVSQRLSSPSLFPTPTSWSQGSLRRQIRIHNSRGQKRIKYQQNHKWT